MLYKGSPGKVICALPGLFLLILCSRKEHRIIFVLITTQSSLSVADMPVLNHSAYKAPFLFSNRHLLTIYPSLFRKVTGVQYQRTRITTNDGDFIDLDFSAVGSDRIVIILHGLEGNSHRQYMLGMAAAFNKRGYDTVCMNFRGCSGEPNKKVRFYHSGETGDLDTVVKYITVLGKYKAIHLAGFSLGGNVLMKYIGESGSKIAPIIKSAVGISVPCDLAESAIALEKKQNIIYMQRFIRELEIKLQLKQQLYPQAINLDNYKSIKTFRQFDDRYTAPMHGFSDAAEYWRKSSSRQYLEKIRIPVLLINALDDPFLGVGCYPYEEARKNTFFSLETPRQGGHVGFVTFRNKHYWSEERTVSFIDNHR
jgi:predicted alpha/beta-fold hydrolase